MPGEQSYVVNPERWKQMEDRGGALSEISSPTRVKLRHKSIFHTAEPFFSHTGIEEFSQSRQFISSKMLGKYCACVSLAFLDTQCDVCHNRLVSIMTLTGKQPHSNILIILRKL